MSNKKYQTSIEQVNDSWTAQIVRQVSKTKTHISKQHDGFASEVEAQVWADNALIEFVGKQQQANVRHAEQRKETDVIKLQRSARRAEKTQSAKASKEKLLEGCVQQNSDQKGSDNVEE